MSPKLCAGIICRVEEPSHRPPVGARGHKVKVTERAAGQFTTAKDAKLLDNHYGVEIGWIEECWVEDGVVKFRAVAFAPLHRRQVSYEVEGAEIMDMWAEVWEMKRFDKFVGLALTDEPAYTESCIT